MTEETITGVAKKIVKSKTIAGRVALSLGTDNASALDIDTPTIDIYVQNPQGGKRKKITDGALSIRKLMEIGTLDPENFVTISSELVMTAPNGGGAVTFADTIVGLSGVIDLTRMHGLQLDKDDELYLDFSGLEAVHGVCIVRTLEESTGALNHIKYTAMTTEGRKNTKFGTIGKDIITIQRHNDFDSVEVRFLNGSNVKMTGAELDEHCRDNFGIVYNRSKHIGASLWISDVQPFPTTQYILDLHEVKEVQVNVNNGTSLEVIVVENNSGE